MQVALQLTRGSERGGGARGSLPGVNWWRVNFTPGSQLIGQVALQLTPGSERGGRERFTPGSQLRLRLSN